MRPTMSILIGMGIFTLVRKKTFFCAQKKIYLNTGKNDFPREGVKTPS